MPPTIVSCRWDWCRSSFPNIDALGDHVKHEHIWPMKPMRRAEIALMRRMDLQSLHSSLDTGSSIVSRGISFSSTSSGPQTSLMTPGPGDGDVSQSKTTPPPTLPTSLPQTHAPPENEFDTFSQLSSPPQIHSPQHLPGSPAFEGLVGRDGHSELSAAVEMFERTHSPRTSQPRHHQRTSTDHPQSTSSNSSQEVVEQQLTQDDGGSQSQAPLPPFSEQQIERESADTELRWPSDDETNALETSEEVGSSEHPVPEQDLSLGISTGPTGDQNICTRSLSVLLDVESHGGSAPTSPEPPVDSEGPHSQSQPFVLQTQAPYFSQAEGWSQ